MAISGIPNKFKIFQEYYYRINEELISYSEALTLYSEMNSDDKAAFERYYKDATGYDVISPSGYGLNLDDACFNDDGTTTNAYKNIRNGYTDVTYTLDAYAKENGLILDPQWAQYSAEEIIQMENQGVNIPQDIIDTAHTIYETTGANLNQTEEGDEDAEETTEKEPYLDLIPKAKKKIEKCNEINEKVDDKIEELLPEKNKLEKSFIQRLKEQKSQLKEYGEMVREWRSLQNKINNGEALSQSETEKYAKITGMLEDKNNKEDDSETFDKIKIANSLNEINIMAVLGEKLAEDTIEIGDTLADYTNKSNYKLTRANASVQIDFLGTVLAMIKGKTLAKDAARVGGDTQEYMDDSHKSAMDIANIMGVENAMTDVSIPETPEKPSTDEEVKANDNKPEGESKEIQTGEETSNSENVEDKESKEEIQNSEITSDKDVIINDDFVKDLIDEAGNINSDLVKQTMTADKNYKIAKKDKSFALIAGKKIERFVKQYKSEQEKREEEIKKLERDNKDRKNDIENITSQPVDETGKEIRSGKSKVNENISETDKEKIKNNKQKIQENNKEIQDKQSEDDSAKEQFRGQTSSVKSQLNEKIPSETQANEFDTQYQNEIIPQDKERLEFIKNTGITLSQMGKYRISVGMSQIAQMQVKKGTKNVTKGTSSTTIGSSVISESDPNIAILAEKTTKNAIPDEADALNKLVEIDSNIVDITGDTVAQQPQVEQTDNQVTGNDEQQNVQTDVKTDNDTSSDAMVNSNVQQSLNTISSSNVATAIIDGEKLVLSSVESSPEGIKGAENDIENTAQKIKQTQTSAVQAQSNPSKASKNAEDSENGITQASGDKAETKKDDKQDMDTDKAQKVVDDTTKAAENMSNDSVKVLADTEKDEKQLEKETKKLQKNMERDQKEIEKLTKKNQEEVEKQVEMLGRYEQLSTESEQLATEDEQDEASEEALGTEPEQDNQNGSVNATSSISISGNQSHEQELQANSEEIDTIARQFKISNSTFTKNQTKIKKLQKTNTQRSKQYDKKNKIRNKKIKEAEKKEQDKNKKNQKLLGVVGVQENIFSITQTTGEIMEKVTLPPWVPVAGAIMHAIGKAGCIACSVTKAIINIAIGNLTGALTGLASTALSVVTGSSNITSKFGKVLDSVNKGMSIVSNSTDLVNNIRAIQGKESSGLMSKISAISGTVGSITGSAALLADGVGEGIKGVAQIAGVVGSSTASVGSIMTEFGGNQKLAGILSSVGSGMSLASSAVALLSASGDKTDEKEKSDDKTNSDSESKTENKSDQDKNIQGTQAAGNNTNPQNNTDNSKKPIEATAQTGNEEIAELSKKTGMSQQEVAQAKSELQNAETGVNNSTSTQEASKPVTMEEVPEMIEANLQSQLEEMKTSNFNKANAETQKSMDELVSKINQQQADEMSTQQAKVSRHEAINKALEAAGQVANTTVNIFVSKDDNKDVNTKKNTPVTKLSARARKIIAIDSVERERWLKKYGRIG